MMWVPSASSNPRSIIHGNQWPEFTKNRFGRIVCRSQSLNNGPEFLQKKKPDLCRKINAEYTLGITNLPKKAHHLIYSYYKKTLIEMNFGRPRDWTKQIRRKNLWTVDNQSHSRSQEVIIYGSCLSSVRGILRKALIKTKSMIKITG